MTKVRIFLFFAGLICLCCIAGMPLAAEILINPTSVVQGQTVVVSGLYHKFYQPVSEGTDASQEFLYSLRDCKVNFNGRDYQFFEDVVDYERYRDSGGTDGVEYISRLATDPFSQAGSQPLTLQCGEHAQTFNISVQKGNFPVQDIKLTPQKSTLTASPEEKTATAHALQTNSAYRLWNPLEAFVLPSMGRISSVYGLQRRYNGVFAKNYFHKGIDFAEAEGAPILSPANGRVVLVGLESERFFVHGNCVFIDHGQGLVSGFLHMSDISVATGDEVQAGQVIGEVGSTGIATGPHLHYGLYMNGVNIDPTPWFGQSMR